MSHRSWASVPGCVTDSALCALRPCGCLIEGLRGGKPPTSPRVGLEQVTDLVGVGAPMSLNRARVSSEPTRDRSSPTSNHATWRKWLGATVGYLPSGCRLGCWQLGKPGTDVSGLGDLQRFAELKGLLPGLTCLLMAAKPDESITKIPQRLGLAPGARQLFKKAEGVCA